MHWSIVFSDTSSLDDMLLSEPAFVEVKLPTHLRPQLQGGPACT